MYYVTLLPVGNMHLKKFHSAKVVTLDCNAENYFNLILGV